MVGSYSSRKNQKFAIDILNELVKKHEDATLTFIGYPRSPKETYLPEMKKIIRKYNLEDKVSFLPQDADIPAAMARSTFLLIPSLQEGLPNVALEAQKMGLPCFISTDVSDDCDCGICTFLPLDKGEGYWAEEITKYVEKNGLEKKHVDMSAWDNRRICEDYVEIWSGRK